MNTFASLEVVFTFRKVRYYTVRIEGSDRTLWEQFLDAHEDVRFEDDLRILRSAMQRIGEYTGAQPKFFRFEGERGGDASALPSRPRFLEGQSTDLRLYCLRYSASVVILFCGAMKTADTPQACDQVRPHFRQANQITLAIQDAVRKGDLREGSPGELLFDEDFELILS